jgi:hypothetical protein
MADAVTSQVILNSERNLVMKFTNISDGTGESAVTKVAAATYGTNVKIKRIHYSTSGMSVQILWDATADVVAWLIPTDMSDTLDFEAFGGITNNGGSGVTGNIQFTTVGHTSGDTYSIILEMTKS